MKFDGGGPKAASKVASDSSMLVPKSSDMLLRPMDQGEVLGRPNKMNEIFRFVFTPVPGYKNIFGIHLQPPITI